MLIDPLILFFASGVGSPKRRFVCSAHDRTTRLLSKNCWGTRLRPRLQNSRFFLKISKEIGKEWRKSINSVSPQSHSPFSASFQTFCLTARAYLNTQKYGLFSSLTSSPGSFPFSKSPFWKPRSHGDDDVKLTHACYRRKFLKFPDYSLTFTWQM